MAVQLSFEDVQPLEWVNQLPEAQQADLLLRLLHKHPVRALTAEEKLALLDAESLTGTVKEEPSIRREDWYGGDGR